MGLPARRDAWVAILAVAATTAAIAIGGSGVFWFGLYNVAATSPHWAATHWLLETGRMRSIRAHAAGLTAPFNLETDAVAIVGTSHFAEHCAICHGAPGVPRGDIARGLYPPPTDLAAPTHVYTAGELFWIIKNGIKSTGMPAWADHADDEIWATAAFVLRLPGMTEAEYARSVMAAIAQGGHRH